MGATPTGQKFGIGRRSLLIGGAATAMFALTKPGLASANAVITANGTGTDNGYFYTFWTNDPGSATMNLKDGGRYSVDWTDSDDVVCGRGWATGDRRVINYSGDYQPSGLSFLAVYGWSSNPLVEYYIIDSWGGTRLTPGTWKGTVEADGGVYDIYQDTRVNAPSVEGTQTFNQFFSIRQSPRTGGSINTGAHFDAWAGLGLTLGTLNYYQVLAVEGIGSSGHADITMS